MSRKNKKNKNPSNQNNNDSYDLKKSLGKLNQKNSLPKSETSIDFEIDKSQNSNINSQNIKENLTSETSVYFKINDTINSRYDSLNQDLKSVRDKISDSNELLRTQIDSKLTDKLDKNIFFYAIAVLVTISSIIYLLSYSSLINDTKNNSNNIKTTNENINQIKRSIEDINEKQKK